jgi:hypothetical protein
LAAAALGIAGVFVTFFTAEGNRHGLEAEDLIVFAAMMPVVGTLNGLAVLALALLSSLVIGLGYAKRAGRNLLPATIQVSSYLSCFVVMWVAICWTIIALLANNEPWFRSVSSRLNLGSDTLMAWTWLLPNLGCLAAYFLMVARATRSTFYANK